MKPTSNQTDLIDRIIQELNFFKSTNDTNSPSHNTSIDDCVYDMNLNDEFKKSLYSLFSHIRSYNQELDLIKKKEISDPELSRVVLLAKKELRK